MDEKFVLTTVAERENGEMLGRVPGNLNSLFADAVEAGHLEIMRAPDATTVIGHRITDSGRDFLAGGATAPVTPADPAEESVPMPEQEPTAPPPPESAPAPEPAPAETTPPVPAATETPASAPEAKPTA